MKTANSPAGCGEWVCMPDINYLARLDRHIGKRIQQRRADWNISEEALAEAIGTSVRELRKYENGKKKVSASTLYVMAYHLQVPIGYFHSELN